MEKRKTQLLYPAGEDLRAGEMVVIYNGKIYSVRTIATWQAVKLAVEVLNNGFDTTGFGDGKHD